jgi:hypothetical protein
MNNSTLYTINAKHHPHKRKVTEFQKDEQLIKIEIKTFFLCFTNSSFSLQLICKFLGYFINLTVSKSAYNWSETENFLQILQKASMTMFAKYLLYNLSNIE